MKIQLTATISGTRNGADWPPAGSIIETGDDFPEQEALDLIAVGNAVEVDSTEAAGEGRAPLPEESVGLAHGHYPDETNRTGDALVDQVGEVTENGPTVNQEPVEVTDTPQVPEDARTASVAEDATVKAPENASGRSGKSKSK